MHRNATSIWWKTAIPRTTPSIVRLRGCNEAHAQHDFNCYHQSPGHCLSCRSRSAAGDQNKGRMDRPLPFCNISPCALAEQSIERFPSTRFLLRNPFQIVHHQVLITRPAVYNKILSHIWGLIRSRMRQVKRTEETMKLNDRLDVCMNELIQGELRKMFPYIFILISIVVIFILASQVFHSISCLPNQWQCDKSNKIQLLTWLTS